MKAYVIMRSHYYFVVCSLQFVENGSKFKTIH